MNKYFLLLFASLLMQACSGEAPGQSEVKLKSDAGLAVKKSALQVRMNVSDFVKDPALVNAFRTATETMRKNGSAPASSVEFLTSLRFWANTHGFFGSGENATSYQDTVNYRLPQCLDYFSQAPYSFSSSEAKAVCQEYYTAASAPFVPDQNSKGIWGTCQHTRPSDRNTPRFLPWHRLYLYYYERTLRKYANNDNFALPYWNYFDYTASNGNLYLPPLVSDGGSVEKNTFYDSLRTKWLNEQKVSMTPDNATATDAFAEPSFVDFSNTLEGLPHGAMHCAVGSGCTTPHMGWVPVAGNDPVFYMHHANIDRLWQCWMIREAGGVTIDLAWAKANLGMPDSWYDISYNFLDEHGKRVTKTIADAFSPEVLAVRYAEEVNCQIEPGKSLQSLSLDQFEAVDKILKGTDEVLMAGKTDLLTRPVVVELLPEATLLKSTDAAADALLDSTGDVPPGIWLVLENIVVKQAPAYTYNVYIGTKKNPARRALVTRFNFFGFGDHGTHVHDGANSMDTRRYYLNDDISELGITHVQDIVVQFVPTNAVTGEPLDLDRESLISIDSIRLVTRR